MAVYGGHTIFAADEEAKKYENFYKFQDLEGKKDYDDLKSEYHKAMNDYFNYKFDLLETLIEKDKKFFENKDFKSPEIVADNFDDRYTEIINKCKTNVSSYCVSMGALDLYMTYLESLNAQEGTLPYVEPGMGIDELLTQIKSRNDDIKEETEEAKFVMEATTAAYNEFAMAYPMHIQYENIIRNLMKYRIALESIHKQVVTFPVRFADATSDQCE